MLVATAETRIGSAGVRSTLVLERAVRGMIFLRDRLAFDTRFAAAAAGPAERVGHLFVMLAGRLACRGASVAAPVAYVLADREIERPHAAATTFRTDGERVHVIQLRFAADALRVPIGIEAGPLALPAACWDAAAAFVAAPPTTAALVGLLEPLASAGVIAREVTASACDDEPERVRRLWATLEPLYTTFGGATSIKQIAASLGLSLRQVGRDAKEMARTFGFTAGYRDALLVLRLRIAVLLLSAPEVTVAEVARLAGYGSAIAMARAFRDAKLPSPTAVQDELGAGASTGAQRVDGATPT